MGFLNGKAYDQAAGRESRSAFIAMAAFWFAAFKFLTSGMSVQLWRGCQIHLGTVDAALLGAFLVPCLGLYWGRRFTDEGARLRQEKPFCSDTQNGPPSGSAGPPMG